MKHYLIHTEYVYTINLGPPMPHTLEVATACLSSSVVQRLGKVRDHSSREWNGDMALGNVVAADVQGFQQTGSMSEVCKFCWHFLDDMSQPGY